MHRTHKKKTAAICEHRSRQRRTQSVVVAVAKNWHTFNMRNGAVQAENLATDTPNKRFRASTSTARDFDLKVISRL